MIVSVIIPCYNAENFIWDCLKSVQKQTYEKLEVIVIDDGSTDSSPQILKEWNNSEILPINVYNIDNRGAAFARNLGLKKASGEYVQFLDADDLILPPKISHQVSLIKKKNISPDFVAAAYKEKSAKDSPIIIKPDHRNPWFGLLSSNLGITSANLFNRSSLEKINGFKESLKSSQEYDLMFRLMRRPESEVLLDNHIYTIKRQVNPDAISSAEPEKNILRFIELRIEMLEHLNSIDQLSSKFLEEWYQVVFCEIKRLYQYNRHESIRLFNELIPEEFVPKLSGPVSKLYRSTYKILGFKASQYIYNLKNKLVT